MNDPKIYLDDDTRLMLKAADGDETAYVRLYKKYFPILVNYATRLDGYQTSPEDLAQEVFMRIWEHRAKYRPYSTVKTYLFSYAKNISREKKGTVSREVPLDLSNLSNQPSELTYVHVITQNNNTIKSIKEQMAKLPHRQRQIFELVYLKSVSGVEVAELLECSPESIYSNLYRARKRLREVMLPLQI